MTHHKISLPCAYLGLCLCLFPIPLNDCKTPNVSRRLKAEGISSLNPTACSHSSGSWTHFGFDCTFPAPLCRAGPGRWPGTRTWERPCISVCAAHQTPEKAAAASKGKDCWFVLSSSALKGTLGKSDQEQEVALAHSSFSAPTKNHPEPEEALSPSCPTKVVPLLWKNPLVWTSQSCSGKRNAFLTQISR